MSLARNGEGRDNNTDRHREGRPNLLDIQLDRTPTDDEIDVLWDKVRDCLLESPASSVRSAPPALQLADMPATNGLPPRQPIKKVCSHSGSPNLASFRI